VGVSISNEIGFQRRPYSTALGIWGIRRIIDKQLGPRYFFLNPAFDRDCKDPIPSKVLYSRRISSFPTISIRSSRAASDITDRWDRLPGSIPFREQEQQIFPALDLNLSPKSQFNAGVGLGVIAGTDHLIVKMIIGYRFEL
jgi:hypothetical protein